MYKNDKYDYESILDTAKQPLIRKTSINLIIYSKRSQY